MSKSTMIVIAVLILVCAAAAACAGFDLGDVVRVQTPVRIQQTDGLPASMTLNESEAEYAEWLASTQRVGAQWKGDIDKGEEVAVLLSNLTLKVLDEAGPTIGGIPVLGAALPLLTGLLGVFIRRPGDVDKTRLAKEKEDSYNAGLDKVSKLAGETIDLTT